ncbi:MAG: hypothetical protein AAGA43_15665 [Bacteroidota bacterium]
MDFTKTQWFLLILATLICTAAFDYYGKDSLGLKSWVNNPEHDFSFTFFSEDDEENSPSEETKKETKPIEKVLFGGQDASIGFVEAEILQRVHLPKGYRPGFLGTKKTKDQFLVIYKNDDGEVWTINDFSFYDKVKVGDLVYVQYSFDEQDQYGNTPSILNVSFRKAE